MTYNATYDGSDTSAIVIDLLGTVLVAVISFGSLIGLVFLYKWLTGRKKVKV